MRITFIDDSIPFDGLTPPARPLGTAEKAFASLPDALSRRGHEVLVFNRCPYRITIEGAVWEPWETDRPAETDVLVAFRKPALLDAVKQAGRRVLWLANGAGYLDRPANRASLEALRPTLVFMGAFHRGTWSGTPELPVEVIPPGLRRDYLDEPDEEITPANPPVAVATTHPLHGLDWLLDVWVDRVHPRNPEAVLHVYSAALDKAELGGPLAEPFRAVYEKYKAAREHGVAVRPPLADPGMADAYRAARAHLYPGSPREAYCGTLSESQAVGLPAVARPLGAAPERVIDGETGFLAPDEETFAEATLRLLDDDEVYARLSVGARDQGRGRGWDRTAAAFEALWQDDDGE